MFKLIVVGLILGMLASVPPLADAGCFRGRLIGRLRQRESAPRLWHRAGERRGGCSSGQCP